MKRPSILLAGSLLANVALGAACLWIWNPADSGPRPAEAGPAPGAGHTDAGRTGSVAAEARATAIHASAEPGEAAALGVLGRLLRSGDGEELTRVLRAAGVPEDLIRAIVREQIQSTFRARIRAIEEAGRGAQPWWQTGGRIELSAEQRAEIRKLQREMRAEVERVLGPDESMLRRTGNYAFLSADKADAARQIDADYNEMGRELRERMQDFRLPSDRDAMRLLEEERRADLVALLTPEELYELDVRTSSTSYRLRRELGSVLASEEEFRQIYDMAVAFEDQYGRSPTTGPGRRGEPSEADAAFRQQVIEFLGPERTAIVARQRDPDYRTMQAATARLSLPSTAIDSVMTARAEAAAESQRIATDPALDEAGRRAALGQVASRVRAQLQSLMGNEGAEAFAQRAQWLRELDRGHAFSVRAEGGVSIQRDGRDD